MKNTIHVLYIDDYAADRELVLDALVRERDEFRVTLASTRAEFETSLALGSFDLVLSDFNILGFDGLQVLDAVAAHDAKLPVIIVTGTGSEAIALEALRRGAADYVIKSPTHVRHLPYTIHAVLERRRLEQERHAAEERLRYQALLLLHVNDAIIASDANYRLTAWNAAAESLYGWTAAEVLGQDGLEIVQTQFPERDKAGMLKAIAETGQYRGEATQARKDGTRFPVEVACIVMRDEQGRITGYVSVNRDITERKRAEEALRQSEARYRRLAENAHDLIYRYRFIPNRGFEYVSAAATKMTGYTPEEHYADPDLGFKLVYPDDRRLLGAVQRGDIQPETPLILRWVRRDGTLVWTEQRNVFIYDEFGNLTAVEGIARDITERKRAEARIQTQLQRLAALHTIDIAIGSSFDQNLVLSVVLEQTIAQLGVDAASVLLLNPFTQTLVYAAGRGFRAKAIERTRLRLGEGLAGRAALERRIVSLQDLRDPNTGFARSVLLAEDGFVRYHAAPLIAKGEIKGVLEVFSRSRCDVDEEWLSFFEALAGQTAIAVDNAQLFKGLQRSNMDLTLAYDATIEGWSRALDRRDNEGEGHTRRLIEMTERLARAAGINDDDLVHLRRGVLLHDIGKVSIPDAILFKPGQLTDEEWAVMRQHPVYAYELLSPIAYLRPALDIPYCHHEKWDGSGYPRGLKGEEIPKLARLFAVVDMWDALRSNRPYRPAWPEPQVREYIQSRAGTDFDPDIVALFLDVLGPYER